MSIEPKEAYNLIRTLAGQLIELRSVVAELTDQLELSDERLSRYESEFGLINERL